MLPLLAVSLSAGALPAELIDRVAQRRIFFGHQSVGGNIVAGLSDIGAGRLTVTEGRNPEAFDRPGFVHTFIGKNEQPASKVADFEAALDAIGGRADIAFFKFCYVDFDANTDVDAVFAEYAAAMARLRAKYPAVTFVHVTAPLTVVQGGPKAWLKKVTGAAPWGAKENAARHRYNELLRAKFAGQPLFDLAALEATKPDGTTQTFTLDGRQVPALAPAWSDDGQHLDVAGRRYVAQSLLSFLAKLP